MSCMKNGFYLLSVMVMLFALLGGCRTQTLDTVCPKSSSAGNDIRTPVDARLCVKKPWSAQERAIYLPGKDGEAGDIDCIVDGAGCSQLEKEALEARATFQTEPNALTFTKSPVGDVTLDQVLALVLMHSPRLQAFSIGVRVAEARAWQAGVRPNPELVLDMAEFGGAGERRQFTGAETTVTLSQVLETGNKRRHRRAVARMEQGLAGWDYEIKRLDVLTEATLAFTAVLGAQQRCALTEQLMGVSEQLARTVAQRVEAGKDDPIEKTKAEVALSRVCIEQQQAQRDLKATRRALVAAWGGTDPAFDQVQGDLEAVDPIPAFEEVTAFIQKNPDVARWAMEMDKARAVVHLEKANAHQDVTVTGGMQRFNVTDETALVFGLTIPLPVADRNQGNLKAAQLDLKRARQQQLAAETQVRASLAQAYAVLSNAQSEIKTLRASVLPGSQAVFNTVSEAYRLGKADYLSLLDAQRTLFEVKQQVQGALLTYHKARAEVERLIGRDLASIQTTPDKGDLHEDSAS